MNLKKGLYTVGGIDNLDHNPSSQTSKEVPWKLQVQCRYLKNILYNEQMIQYEIINQMDLPSIFVDIEKLANGNSRHFELWVKIRGVLGVAFMGLFFGDYLHFVYQANGPMSIVLINNSQDMLKPFLDQKVLWIYLLKVLHSLHTSTWKIHKVQEKIQESKRLQSKDEVDYKRIFKLSILNILICDYHDTFQCFKTMAEIMLTIPLTFVPCERGFSLQNRHIGRYTSRRNVESVQNRMMIGWASKQKDFDEKEVVRKACQKWNNVPGFVSYVTLTFYFSAFEYFKHTGLNRVDKASSTCVWCELTVLEFFESRNQYYVSKSENAVKRVMEAFQSLINPFEVDDESKLYPLACDAAASDEVTQEVLSAEEIGKKAKERLEKNERFFEPIKRQKLK
ncbi:hypothetical protein GQR58_030042 [Nymphon striatum]|nr:hypothetical protein GQR58_030042 [Nymphon striatum]